MALERLRVLQAAHALGEFTIPELSGYAGVAEPTVRSVLQREAERDNAARIVPSANAASMGRGRPRQLWTVRDPAAIRRELDAVRAASAYPEEVEEVVKTHATVHDAIVVGVPDERFGQAIVVFVEPAPDAIDDEAELIAYVNSQLAAFKSPRSVPTVESIGRASIGRVDYRRLGAEAKDRHGPH